MHFYKPAEGHRLPHDPFNAIVGPRPIGWISSVGNDGSVNLAPYSFFNGFNYRPPIIGFASTGAKDTLRNVQETGEFVWNFVTASLLEKMNATSAPLDYETNEFSFAGLTQIPSELVRPPRVAESPVHFECRVTQILQLKTKEGADVQTWMTFGEVVGVHIHESLLKEGVFDTFGADVILRAGGPSAYARILPESRLDIFRPTS